MENGRGRGEPHPVRMCQLVLILVVMEYGLVPRGGADGGAGGYES